MTYWTRIDQGTAVGVQNDRGRFSRRHNDVNSRRPSRCLRSPVGRYEKPSPRTLVSACALFKYGSKISVQRWRSFREKPKLSPDPTKSRRKSEGRKVRIATTVRTFPQYHFNRENLSHICFNTTDPSWFLGFLLDPKKDFKYR